MVRVHESNNTKYDLYIGTNKLKIYANTNSGYLFYQTSAKTINFKNFYTSKITNMNKIFSYSKVPSLDLRNFKNIMNNILFHNMVTSYSGKVCLPKGNTMFASTSTLTVYNDGTCPVS